MPFKPPVQEKCPKCGKAVYSAEEKLAAGKKWHKMCLKCGLCQKYLESTNLSEHAGEIFCRQCYGRKYGPKGYGFGGGAGALCMDKGEHFGNVECDMSNKPTGHGGGPVERVEGGCPRCGGRVYEAERRSTAGLNFHATCFNCKDCHKALDSTSVCDNEGEIYCKGCYGKNFGPKGVGFGVGAGCLSTGQ